MSEGRCTNKERDEIFAWLGCSIDDTESINRIFKIKEIVLETFDGNESIAAKWMMSPTFTFHGKCPFDLMTNDEGALAVVTLLKQMDKGIYT